jgi:hypothetical protein
LDHVCSILGGWQGANTLFSIIDRPYNLEDVMLTEETFVSSIKQLEKHLVHIWDQVYLPVDGYALETEKTIIYELKVPIVFYIVHSFIARL